ncbi:MAG: hypothetical protein ACRC1P_05435 [Cellulosilyticaceae bacterium]
MFQIIILEILGMFSILNIYILWEQKSKYHLIAGILIGVVLGIYCMIMKKKQTIKKISMAIMRKTSKVGYMEALTGLRQIGIGLGIMGLIILAGVFGMGNRVSIRIEEVGEMIALVSTIILDILLIETFIIGPLIISTLYNTNKNGIAVTRVDKQLKANKTKSLSYEVLGKMK